LSTHNIPVVKIEEIQPHPNADRLELVFVLGYQVVVQKGQFKIGDLAIYIPPDSIVPERPEFSFVWEKDGSGQPRNLPEGVSVPEKYRRITVKKLRKEWSEGLLMPISIAHDLPSGKFLTEGDDVAERLGIEHWNPPDDPEVAAREASVRQSKTMPRSLKGWYYFLKNWSLRLLSLGFYDPWGNTGGGNEKAPRNTPPVYDVENLKNYADVFVPGEQVVVTEKIHGSNARYLYQASFGSGHVYAGSRQLWKSPTSNSIWREVLKFNPEIERWLRDNPGYTLYGEVVPTQGGFEYGHKKTEPWFYAFDILSPEGKWLNYSDARPMTAGYDIEWVPLLYMGPYDAERIQSHVDGPTRTGANHIREGVVIKTDPERHAHGLGRVQLKLVSNEYLKKE